MSAPRISRNVLPAVAALLCGIGLSACERNNGETLSPPSTAPVQVESEPVAPPAQALEELDAAARKVKLTQSRLCNIEMIDGVKPTPEASKPKNHAAVEFSGWVGNERTGMRPTDARLRFESLDRKQMWEWSVGAPVVRKDVAKFVNVPTLEDAGFQTTVDLSSLQTAEYRVYLVFGDASDSFVCDPGRRILR